MLSQKVLRFSQTTVAISLFAALLFQVLPSRASAQRISERAVAEAPGDPRALDAEAGISPDLEEIIQAADVDGNSSRKQRVIIQLRSAAPLDHVDAGQSMSQLTRAEMDEMFDGDARANEMRAPVLREKIERLHGRFRRSLNRLGLISADLPLSKIREMLDDPEVAYISPDRAVESFGHIEMTTGASYVDARTEVSYLSNCNGTGVGVAVLDSGVDDTHNLTKATSSHTGVVYSKSFTGALANRDYYGHGTHVASILAGDNAFKSGAYTGIAYDVKVLSLAVLDSQGKGLSSNVVSAIDWCIANKSTYNIRVINMSLGCAPKDTYTTDPLCLAARRAHNAGIVVVASAGNNGKTSQGNKIYGGINSPGIDPSVITVGATNSYGTDLRSDDTMATYSSHGPTRGYKMVNGQKKYDNLIKPDIVAPGNRVIGACSPSSLGQTYSLVTQTPSLKIGTAPVTADQVMYLSGTSMSAPIVAGAAALMVEANPSLTPALVKAILMYTAQPMSGVNSFEQGAGRLNVEAAVHMASTIVSNCASLGNGASMLTTPLPNPQENWINDTEKCVWGRGIITNYGFLYGSNLMTYWQGAYAAGKILADATLYSNNSLVRSTTLTSSGVSLYCGSITNNSVLLSDGTLLTDSTLLADGTLLTDGTMLSDGTILTDGTLLSDSATSASRLGDNTACMQPAP